MFKTAQKDGEAIIIEKKSKFIANVFYIESEEEAENILNTIRKRYHDARHHCYAYRLHSKNGVIEKQSDDRRTFRDSRSSNAKYINKERT